MKSYSQDLRDRIIQARSEGAAGVEVARRFGVCKRTVERCWKRFVQTGSRTIRTKGRPLGGRLSAHMQSVLAWIDAQRDLTLREICVRLRKELAVVIGKSTLAYHLERAGLTCKKNGFRRRTRTRGRAPGSRGMDKGAAFAARRAAPLP